MFNFLSKKYMTQGGRIERALEVHGEKIQDIQKTLADVLDIVRYMKESFVTREELHDEMQKLEERLEDKMQKMETQLEDKIISHVDGFVKLHNNHEAEISALRIKMYRLEEGCVGA